MGDGRLAFVLLCAKVWRNAGCPVRVMAGTRRRCACVHHWHPLARGRRILAAAWTQEVVVVIATAEPRAWRWRCKLVRPRGTMSSKALLRMARRSRALADSRSSARASTSSAAGCAADSKEGDTALTEKSGGRDFDDPCPCRSGRIAGGSEVYGAVTGVASMSRACVSAQAPRTTGNCGGLGGG